MTAHDDDDDDTPMFPLGMPLLPANTVALRVFEPRYHALVRRCLENDAAFGIVLIERGHEVGGGDTRGDVGCLARIVRHERVADGSRMISASGVGRIVVDRWLADDPYPRAVVRPWPDELQRVERAALRDVVAQVRRVRALLVERGAPPTAGAADRDLDEIAAGAADPDSTSAWTFLLAGLSAAGPYDLRRLLCAPGPADRLSLLAEVLDDSLALLEARPDGGGPDGPRR
ncbi:MAG TPA: hypothetical protein DEP66_06985 [Acidimicrobiaceae bacterium]|nr:hypothetical protein [Acidimicrobiaceae bacterium]HCB37924.1 hypothetical protein [Acidimicrobiaceae bacterium]